VILITLYTNTPVLTNKACFFIFRGLIYGEGCLRIDKKNKQEVEIILANQEKKLIEIMRDMGYGELHITVKGGLPVHLEEIKKSIKL